MDKYKDVLDLQCVSELRKLENTKELPQKPPVQNDIRTKTRNCVKRALKFEALDSEAMDQEKHLHYLMYQLQALLRRDLHCQQHLIFAQSF